MRRPSSIAPVELLQRVPPHNDEAEAGVLGGILLNSQAIYDALETLRHDDFYHVAHQKIFSAMIDLCRQGEFDEITVSNLLEERGELDCVGGRAYISSLGIQALSPALVTRYAAIVREKSLWRGIIAITSEAAVAAYGESEERPSDLATQVGFDLAKLTERSSTQDWATLHETGTAGLNQLDAASKAPGGITGVESGIGELDRRTRGFQNGELTILAGRPGMGKTAFALNILEHAAIEQAKVGAFFSLEMGKVQLGIRLIAGRARIDPRAITSGYERNPWPALSGALNQFANTTSFVSDKSDSTLAQIRGRCMKLAMQKHGLHIVLIDYLQLVKSDPGKRYGNREQEVATLSSGFKSLARELNVPVILLAQLNRSVESTEDKRPNMAHLRESGSLEQDADLILLLYRKELYFPKDQSAKGRAEIIIGKARNGVTGTVDVTYIAPLTRFENPAREYDRED